MSCFIWRCIYVIKSLANQAEGWYSFHRQWGGSCLIVWCGNLTILLSGLTFHCFWYRKQKTLCDSLHRPSRSDFVQLEFVEEKRVMNLEDLRIDCAIKQKRGIHFISASIVIWLLVMMVQFLDLPILTKNLLTFCCTAPLLPLAFLMSKLLKIQFQDKSNPLNNLGILFSINQILYLLIAMWIYPTVPEKMLMVIAMIFGAHLLPYSWLYKSKTYMIMSVLIPIASLIVGCNSTRLILALMMLVFEIIFTALLIIENRKI